MIGIIVERLSTGDHQSVTGVSTSKIVMRSDMLRSIVPSRYWTAAWATAAIIGISVDGATATAPRPNIVFIMADDLGIGDLGFTTQNARAAAGLPAIATPHLDQLAASSVQFTQMYSGAPVCSPSRASLLTGFEMNRVIVEHTDLNNGFRSGPDDDKTWGQILQDAGYKTGMWGKWHVGGVISPGPNPETRIIDPTMIPTQQGFETVFGSLRGGYRTNVLWENDGLGGLKYTNVVPDPSWPGPGLSYRYSQDVTSDHAVNYIRQHASGTEPFAMYVAFEAVHDPFDRVSFGDYADRDWPDVQKQYANMVTGLDRNVGDLIAAIEDPNNDGDKSDSIAGNTLIVFTSDNGALWSPHASGFDNEFFDSNGSFRGAKSNTLEGGIRTPFLVRWDGVTTPGTYNTTHVGSFADMLPTFAELAGEEVPFGVDGQSMLPAILGAGSSRRSDALVWTSKDSFGGMNQASYALRLGDWKYIRRVLTNSDELFRIEDDPFEQSNLSAARPDIVAALKQVAVLEGLVEEPFFRLGNVSEGRNVYFTQYKYWEPTIEGNSFLQANNWSGGTQRNRSDDPDAMYWNTGPANNWLARVDNNWNGYRNAWVSQNASVLALAVSGTSGVMQVNVTSAATLEAYNGVRIEEQGIVRLVGGTLKTVRQVEIRSGGKLTGAGTITGWQSILAGIPEFANQGLLATEVVNAGEVEIFGGGNPGLAGLLQINGDYVQRPEGTIAFDIFNGAGAAGSSFDRLNVSGTAVLDGAIHLSLMGDYVPETGESFVILIAQGIIDLGVSIAGQLSQFFSLSVLDDAQLVATYGEVPASIFAEWQANYGTTAAAGDADGSGFVDGADFLQLQRQFNQPPLVPVQAAVPEPAAAALAAIGFALAVLQCRGR